PRGFDPWFRKATQQDPDRRFQSAREMALALAEAMGDELPLSDPDSLDSLDRASIELSDTLAAQRASEGEMDAGAEGADTWDSGAPELATGDSTPAPEVVAEKTLGSPAVAISLPPRTGSESLRSAM